MKCFPFLTCGAFLLLQILLMGAWPEHRAAPHRWQLLDSQLEENHWKQKEPWLPAQHPILGAGTWVSWPPSKTLSPGLASRCQRIGPQSYSLVAPLRVIPALSQWDLTLCGAKIRPLGRSPSCGASPGWRGAISGAKSGCKSPSLSSCRAWLEPSAVRDTHREVAHAVPLLPSQCQAMAMPWLWQGQQGQPCSISSLPPSG